MYANFPEKLRSLSQWVMWKKEIRKDKDTGEEKVTKVPYQTSGGHASSTDSRTWTTFEEAVNARNRFDGIGFVFVEGIIGIDLDHCFEADGTITAYAKETIERFPSYTERSPSGEGLHIIIESDVAVPGRKLKRVECYSSGRFFTVTGDVFEDRRELRDCDVAEWYAETFPEEKKTQTSLATTGGYLPDDEKILSVMFRSKGGRKMQGLFQTGSYTAAGYGSQSEADLSFIGALMFFCRNNQIVVDRIFRQSKLMRDKWDEKRGAKTYGQQTMDEAIKSEVMEWKEPKVTVTENEEYIMSEGKNPVPLLILENVCLALERDEQICSSLRLNDFSHTIEIRNGNTWNIMQDNDVLDIERYISRKWPFFAKIGKEMTVDAIRQIANKTKVNPPVDYLRSLKWDEVPRLDFWLHVVFGVPNDELHEKIGANWMKGLVSRVLHPGCQFDQVLVLEGSQGWRKSTALRVLGSPWHVESTLSTEDTDFYMLLARNVIVEFSEGEIVGRTSARRLKAIITKTEDTYRAPYERGHQTYKRGCVFAMTTNDNDYQKDETGGRRWLPVVLTRIADIDWLSANRDQLYAEAVYRVENMKETTYEYPQEELTRLQEEKKEEDDYSEGIVRWYENLTEWEKDQGITPLIAYKGAIDSEKVEISKDTGWRIKGILKGVLKLESKNKKVGDRVLKRWFPKR